LQHVTIPKPVIMESKKQNAWNFTSLFFFFGLVVGTGYLLEKNGIDVIKTPIWEFVLMALASYRMTRVLVFEKIFKYFRDLVRSQTKYHLIHTIKFIITCPWCAGVWVSLIIVIFYFLVPYGKFLVFILAISGIASFFIQIVNFMGLTIEEKQGDHGD